MFLELSELIYFAIYSIIWGYNCSVPIQTNVTSCFVKCLYNQFDSIYENILRFPSFPNKEYYLKINKKESKTKKKSFETSFPFVYG